ncbi:MAG: polysaccharide biosynthesis tyrosine autokinase [Niabella sp.]|nr:polysaccharide biosynthesis tyrosine autokinase [Niabella sp.]
MQKDINWEDEFESGGHKSDNKALLRFIHRVRANWYWFLLCGIMGFTGAFIYLRYTLPQYKIHAKLLVSDDKKGGSLLQNAALSELSGIMGAKSSVENEVEVLKTADLMHEMVLAEKAYVSYFKPGTVHSVPVMQIPYQVTVETAPDSIQKANAFDITDAEKGFVQLRNPDTTLRVALNQSFCLPGTGTVRISKDLGKQDPAERYGFSILPVRKVVEGLRGALTAEVTNKQVSTIDLTLQYTLPKRGEQFLRTLINKYVERNLTDKNEIADSTLAFINARLEKVTEELAEVEDRISGYKKETRLADISQQSRILLEGAADFTRGLAEADGQLASLDIVADYLKDRNRPRVVPSALLPQDATFSGLTARYNDLILQRERMLLSNTENNPLVKNVDGQIAGLRQDMISNLANTRNQLEQTRRSQQQLASRFNGQLNEVPLIERGYIDLARLQQIKQAQYVFLQEKWEETAIGRTANVANSKVIDVPKAEELPFAPQKKMVYALGLLLGLALPLVTGYFRDLLNVRVRGVEDVQAATALPVLGVVAHSENEHPVVVTPGARSAIAEQFRAVRTNLEFSLNGGNTILFTSSMSNEGKSFIALNLAMSLALLDKKVLLMELDLRKPSITAKLGLQRELGFSHYIVRPELTIEDIIRPSGIHENVFLVQAGVLPPNPAELLVNKRAAQLFEQVRKQYDYVLMDTPPVGMVTDAQLLSRYSDLCLYLVRQGYTYKEQLHLPDDLVTQEKIKPIQLIVNDVRAKGGYYGKYGYGYGYGYGYYGQQPGKRKWWQIRKKA